jgi:hypothetical protein
MKVLQFPLELQWALWDLNHLYIKPETHLLFILLAIALFVLLPVIFYKIF